ncbi:hypothetical protein ACVWY3_006903 [Bradyrhizobium sp. USDA 4486]
MLVCQGATEYARLTTIEAEIGCDPVCAVKPDWNTTAPPIGDSPHHPKTVPAGTCRQADVFFVAETQR